MGPPGSRSVTQLLAAWGDGDRAALEVLTPLVYDELHKLASAYMRREHPWHTLRPTELVSEAFVRMAGGEPLALRDRVHFYGLAARHMRNILVDHARKRTARKRGGADRPVTFDEALVASERPDELLALDEALTALAAQDERKARAIELCYFGGLTHAEIAVALGVHENTVLRELRLAEAWLNRYLTRTGA